MSDQKKENRDFALNARELSCGECNGKFIFREYEREMFEQRGWALPKRCPACRKAAREQQQKEQERQENEKWQQEKAAEKKIFEERLKDWCVISKDEIRPKNDQVLYIIGNGFDLMHNVRSSYYAFRDSLGKHSQLRFALENFLKPEDIWADFEDALAHFRMDAMADELIVDDWLDIFGAYDEDAGAAECFLAAEAAADPILTVADELPRRFRMWVEQLSIGTSDRPLQGMFRNGKVLCFNYTEFVETLYGVPEENVCYIHGCRRKKKYHPKEKLILGHMPGASEEEYGLIDDSSGKIQDPYRQYMAEAFMDQTIRLIAESDEKLTKNCNDIIASHQDFFESLGHIENVIVIGHSFSPVDWDYFSQVASKLPDIRKVHWYFGCYGLRDLTNLEQLLARLGIRKADISVFCTDDITVAPLKDKKAPMPSGKLPTEKIWCTSAEGRWMMKTANGRLSVIDQEKKETNYETALSSFVSKAFFAPSGGSMLVIIRGIHPGILLFGITDGHWRFVNELKSIPNQSLINPRLKHVFLNPREITFVYNSRMRKYSLTDGRLIYNKALRNGGSVGETFLGKDYRSEML